MTSPASKFVNGGLCSDPLRSRWELQRSDPGRPRFATRNEDIGLQKNMKLSDKFRLRLWAEFLNSFNRVPFSGIQARVTSPQFGQVTISAGIG